MNITTKMEYGLKFTAMTSFHLNYEDIQSLLVFLRDYSWETITGRQVLSKYLYDTCGRLYTKLTKCKQQAELLNKQYNTVKVSFNDLELLSVMLLSRSNKQHFTVKTTIDKILLDVPIEVINILESIYYEKSTS